MLSSQEDKICAFSTPIIEVPKDLRRTSLNNFVSIIIMQLIGQLIFKEATWLPFTQKSYLTPGIWLVAGESGTRELALSKK